jgi:hypothetical protein
MIIKDLIMFFYLKKIKDFNSYKELNKELKEINKQVENYIFHVENLPDVTLGQTTQSSILKYSQSIEQFLFITIPKAEKLINHYDDIMNKQPVYIPKVISIGK